jgi:hypothetical protein
MPLALTEIEAAHQAGFKRWRDFRAALRRGQFPQPDQVLADGPRWSQTRIERWLSGEPDGRQVAAEEEALMRRLDRGRTGSPSGPPGPPRR